MASFRLAKRSIQIAAVALLLAGTAAADTFIVDNFGDDPGNCSFPGQCTLRQAVTAANASAGDDLIKLEQGRTHLLGNQPSTGISVDSDTITIAVFTDPVNDIVPTPSPFDTVIDAAGAGRAFIVQANATLDLSGVSLRNGVIGTNSTGGAVAVLTDGTLVLSDSVLTGNQSGIGGGLGLTSGAQAVLTRVIVSGNEATANPARGGGIESRGALTLTDVTVAGNFGDFLQLGGGIYVDITGSLAMTRGGVSSHAVTSNGGGIWVDGPGPGGDQLDLDGTYVTGNQASNAGAGIHIDNNVPSIRLSAVTIQGNTGGGDGGGVRIEGGDVLLENVLISENTSTGLRGGGIAFSGAGTLTINDSEVRDNTAPDNPDGVGGGLWISGSSLTVDITGALFEGNRAFRNGAGIHAAATTTLTITETSFTDNDNQDTAIGGSGNGGAIFASNTTLTVVESDFTLNDAGLRGGAMYVENAPSVRIVDTNISDNSVIASNGDGGALNLNGNTSVQIVRSTIARNSTPDGGGAIFAFAGGTIDILNSTFSGNASGNVGGAINAGNTVNITNVTFAENGAASNGEILAGSGINIFSSILEHDPANGVDVCANNVANSDFNVLESGAGSGSCGLVGTMDRTRTAAEIDLQPLAFNGGPFGLDTHALGASTTIADLGDPSRCTVNADPMNPLDSDFDNRFAPRIAGTTCDPGAYESGSLPIAGVLTIRDVGPPNAQGAMPGIQVLIAGVLLGLDTMAGETTATVAAMLAAAINMDPRLMALGIKATVLGNGDTVSIAGLFDFAKALDPGLAVSSTDFGVPLVPALGVLGLVALLGGLLLVALRELRAAPGGGHPA